MSERPRYTVGIDLGTTNCVVARGDPDERRADRAVETLEVPQLQAPGEVVARTLLPSFLYLPGPHELPEGAADLPWGPSTDGVVGEMARRRVVEAPDRVVHSAKSWLCHDGVDRRIAFLPRSPAELERRVSPVEASAAYLAHLRRSWDHLVGRGRKELALARQDILVTVPASFGEVARQLTVEAARAAGLERLHIVEEPQAAFYSWLAAHSASLDEALEGLELILVVDVGGGTTDLTLIRVSRDEDGAPELERVAVGEHLMLGGDNMDLALAAMAEPRLGRGARLDGRAWQALRQSCRAARELLLAEGAPESASVVVPGRGSRLVGGQLRAELTRDEVRAAVLDGFFPEVGPDARVAERTAVGLKDWGLPYAQDTAVSRHVARFLRRYREETDDRAALSAVLLNGGVLNSPLLADRLVSVISGWTSAGAAPPRLLATRSLDLAVAVGAAHYGLVRRGLGLRIVSGLPRAVYVGLEVRAKRRKGKRRVRRAALCLAPKGLREGQSVELRDQPLRLTVGQEVVFPLYEDSGKGGALGEVRSADDPRLVPLPPVRAKLPGSGRRQVPVALRARLSEVGTLEVLAAAEDGSDEFRLELDLRARLDEGATAEREQTSDLGLDPDRVDEAVAILRAVFAPDSEPPRWKLVPRLEGVLRSKRDNWPLVTVRALFDEALRPDQAFYGGPPEITAAWQSLVGFCLRPGLGFGGDPERMELMVPVLEAGCRSWDGRVRSEWWILWRRLAGGLDRGRQARLFKTLLGEMGADRGGAGQPGGLSGHELTQMWMLAASLERVAVRQKRDLGESLLDLIEQGTAPTAQAFWCLGRLGARSPVHGGIEDVVPVDRAARWVERVLALPESGLEHLSLALMMLSRRTDDRSRDLDPELRARVLGRLRDDRAPARLVEMVERVVEDEPLEGSVLGESLPPGLRLMA